MRRQRENMLRGVYEENLRLKEPGSYSPRRQQPERPAKWSAIAAIVLLVVATVLLDRIVGWLAPGLATPSHTASPLSGGRPVDKANAAAGNSDAHSASPAPVPSRLPAGAAPPVAAEVAEGVSAAPGNASATVRPAGAPAVDLPIRTVVIDAGHGGRDTGAIGQAGGREKDIALDLARRLREKLAQRPDYRVFLVRETDAYMPLNERVSYVNSLDTDLFISLHTNELPGTSTDSLELYYFGPNPDPRTRNLAKLENRHWSYEISEYEERLNAPMRLEASKGFAESIRTSFLKSRQPEGRTTFKPIVGTAALVVLLGVKAPSVLVEIGTLSTQEGERSMNQPQYRENIATELANGITAYLNDQPRQ